MCVCLQIRLEDDVCVCVCEDKISSFVCVYVPNFYSGRMWAFRPKSDLDNTGAAMVEAYRCR